MSKRKALEELVSYKKPKLDIFSNYDVISYIFTFLDANDLKRLCLVSRTFNSDITYYRTSNKNYKHQITKLYIPWFNNHFKYTKIEIKKKKEGNILKNFIKMFLREYKVAYDRNKRRLSLYKEKLSICDCEKCTRKLSYVDNEFYSIKLLFNTLFYYDSSYKFIKLFNSETLLNYADSISDIIKILPLKTYKLLLVILMTKGIRYIYNAKYESCKSYCIHIIQWSFLEEFYHILVEIDNHITKLFDKHNYNTQVRKLINNYFTNDECVGLLFQYMSNFCSINKKRKKSFIDEFIN